jgi:hypothetical protein
MIETDYVGVVSGMCFSDVSHGRGLRRLHYARRAGADGRRFPRLGLPAAVPL